MVGVVGRDACGSYREGNAMKYLLTVNWKTTAGGLLTIFTSFSTLILQPMLDNDPETVAQWAAFIPIFISGMTALFARDWNVTSKQSGLE